MTLLFADDIMYFVMYDPKEGQQTASDSANKYLSELEQWANKWRLELAPHKCEYIVFTLGKQDQAFVLNLYGTQIPNKKSLKFLGISFDSRLTFQNHIQDIRDKLIDRQNLLKILSFDSTWRLK